MTVPDRRYHALQLLQRYVVDPPVRLVWRVRLIAQHGHRTGWVRDTEPLTIRIDLEPDA